MNKGADDDWVDEAEFGDGSEIESTFRPSDALRFLSFQRELESIERLWAAYKRHRKRGAKMKSAFYHAWKTVHRSGEDALPSLGARDFWSLIVGRTDYSQLYADTIVSEYAHPFRKKLRAHNGAANRVSPVKLLQLWIRTRDRVDRLGRLACFEAKRNYVFGSQFSQIQIADPDQWISDDVVAIDELSLNRLFVRDASQDVYTVFVLDTRKYNRLVKSKVRVTLSYDEAKRWFDEWTAVAPTHHLVKMEERTCRVVRVKAKKNRPERLYYVEDDDRRKRSFSRLRKYEHLASTWEEAHPEEGVAHPRINDSRGMLLTVVSIHEGDELRLPTRSCALALKRIAKRRMWSKAPLSVLSEQARPLRRLKDAEGTHRDSNPDYWDAKIIGNYRWKDDDRFVEVLVEQKFTTLQDRINEENATDDLNHGVRRGKQILRLLKSYFPVEIYSVDWDSQAVQDRLLRYWEERFSD
ncbi:MAG: hypothetical protein WC813_00435 [Patescibacteria group bacterium]|jgi:hypothetical protein